MHWPAKARRKVAEVGMLYALQQTKWTFLPNWLIELNGWQVNTIDVRGHAVITRHDSALRWAKNRDIPGLLACGVQQEVLAYAFGKTLKIVIFEVDGRIVGYGQYAVRSWEQSDWLRFHFAPRDFNAAEVWVAPDFRGRGIGPKILAFATSHFARNGYRRAVAIINLLNKNSIRACAKVAPVSTEHFWYCRLIGFSYFRYGALSGFGRWSRHDRLDVMLGRRDTLPPLAAETRVETVAPVIPFKTFPR